MQRLIAAIFSVFFLLKILTSCRQSQIKTDTSKRDSIREANIIKDSIREANFIYEAAINSPEFNTTDTVERLFKYSQIKDSELGLILKVFYNHDHKDFYKNIVYIKSKTGFEYAFPYIDEEQYSNDIKDNKNPNRWKREILEREFNYIITQIRLNQSKKRSELLSFISFFEAIWGPPMVPYDTLRIADLEKGIHRMNGSIQKVSSEAVKNYERMISELRNKDNDSVRYFVPFQCPPNAFWRFEIIRQADSRLFVKIAFINKEYCNNDWF